MNAPVKIFRWEYRIRFQDADAAGILFYARIFDMFHDAYVVFLGELGRPLWKSLEISDVIIPLVHADADYLAPLRFGDMIRIDISVLDLSSKSFKLGYKVTRTEDSVWAASGHTVHVSVLKEEFKSTSLPDDLRAALKEYHNMSSKRR
jgi:1,4-dihydroxy-2-naphthoyl-CoA hydrolase